MPIRNSVWTRLFLEGLAVVISILLAFAIDAAWQERQEKQEDMARLEGLYREFQTHQVLLAEAITAHRKTLEYGYELLGQLAADPATSDAARLTELLDGLLDSYRINAPFGSLETAISSGTIARMRDVNLASRLASWPTAIEDLMEEQETSNVILTINFYAKLGGMVSLRDVYGRRLSHPGMRGTGEVMTDVAIGDLPGVAAPADYSVLHGNISLANDLMNLMAWAQSSLGEATLADEQLSVLMENLAGCLASRDC